MVGIALEDQIPIRIFRAPNSPGGDAAVGAATNLAPLKFAGISLQRNGAGQGGQGQGGFAQPATTMHGEVGE
ncbi:hypothetical protein D3C76_579100 [compost metagenome]